MTPSQAPAVPPAAPAVEGPQPPASPQAGPPAAPPTIILGAQGDVFHNHVGQGGGYHRRWCQYLLCLKGCTEIPKPHCIRCGSAMVIYIDRVDNWFWLGWKCLNCGTSWGKWEVDERLTRLAIDELEWTLPGPRGLGGPVQTKGTQLVCGHTELDLVEEEGKVCPKCGRAMDAMQGMEGGEFKRIWECRGPMCIYTTPVLDRLACGVCGHRIFELREVEDELFEPMLVKYCKKCGTPEVVRDLIL